MSPISIRQLNSDHSLLITIIREAEILTLPAFCDHIPFLKLIQRKICNLNFVSENYAWFVLTKIFFKPLESLKLLLSH